MGKTKSRAAAKNNKRTAKTTKRNVWAKKTSEGHQMTKNRPGEIDHINPKHALVLAIDSHG